MCKNTQYLHRLNYFKHLQVFLTIRKLLYELRFKPCAFTLHYGKPLHDSFANSDSAYGLTHLYNVCLTDSQQTWDKSDCINANGPFSLYNISYTCKSKQGKHRNKPAASLLLPTLTFSSNHHPHITNISPPTIPYHRNEVFVISKSGVRLHALDAVKQDALKYDLRPSA